VAGVVSPLIADNDFHPFRQEINDFSLSLIAPLGTDNN